MNKKTAILLAMSAIQALAQESIYTLDTLSVTALREEESVQSQPLSIVTKQTNEIELDQVIFQKDLLNSLAGVRIEQTGSIIGHKTSIRMPMTTDPYYLFLQDGIPVQSSGFFNHNGLAYTTFGSANSVEVLKGTGTALYGSDSMAGTINVLGAADPAKKLERSIATEVGSDGYRSAKVGLTDTIDNKNSYRMNLRYDQSQGWRDHTEYDRIEANGRYDHIIDNDNAVKIMVSATKSDAEQADEFTDYSYIENGSTAASVDGSTYFVALAKTDVRRKFDYARIAAEFTNYSFNDAEITITPYVRYNRNRYVATWEKPNYPSNDSIQKSVGLMEKTKFTPAWGRIITGFDTEYTQGNQKTDQEFAIGLFREEALYDYSVDYFAIAPYLHTDFSVSQKLTLSAGVRYDYNHYDYTNNLGTGFDNSGNYFRSDDRKDSFDHLSPKASIAYQAMENINIYARYANGFRIPQTTMLYSLKKNYEVFTLEPEISDSYEIGMKIGDKKNYCEVSGYYMSIDNTFTPDVDGVSGLKNYVNGGESIHKGLELSGSAQLNDEWEAKAAYSYSKHNYNNNTEYGDNEMASAPNHMANTRLFYSPIGVRGLTFMGEWQYIGTYWMDDSHIMKYGGYSIGNVKVNYKIGNGMNLYTKVTNLTDERYATSAVYTPSYNKESYTPGDPRQFFAGLEYTW